MTAEVSPSQASRHFDAEDCGLRSMRGLCILLILLPRTGVGRVGVLPVQPFLPKTAHDLRLCKVESVHTCRTASLMLGECEMRRTEIQTLAFRMGCKRNLCANSTANAHGMGTVSSIAFVSLSLPYCRDADVNACTRKSSRGAFQRFRETEGFADKTEKRRGLPANFRKIPRLERLETVHLSGCLIAKPQGEGLRH